MVHLPKIIDTFEIPDPNTFRDAANHLQTWHAQHQDHMKQLNDGHANLQSSWEGSGFDQYSQLHGQVQQLQDTHQQQRESAAGTHIEVALLLEAAQIAQDIAIGLLAGAGIEIIAGFFTAGATDLLAAPEIAEAVVTEGTAQAQAQAARLALQNGFKALMGVFEGWKNRRALFDIGGAGIGAASGLTYGITHHKSLSDTLMATGMDAWMGFDAGKNLSSGNPLTALKTLGGMGVGAFQYATDDNKGDEDPFSKIVNMGLLSSGGHKPDDISLNDGEPKVDGDGVNEGNTSDPNSPSSDDVNPLSKGGGGGGDEPPGNGQGTSRGSNEPPRQNTTDITQLYKDAGPAQQELKQFATDFAEKTGGTTVLPENLKSMERALDKIRTDYKGDPSRLVDIARGTIKYDTLEQITHVREQIESELQHFSPDSEIVRVKDRFANPTDSGYRDLLYNLKMSNGHIVELQIHLTPIEAVKSAEHELYEQVQNIMRNAGDRALTAEEINKIASLNEQSRNVYEEALRKAGGFFK